MRYSRSHTQHGNEGEKNSKNHRQALTLADDEITKLQTELALLKTQKKGLIQKLLTGQIRVKI
ncbi:MAG: hypothetical protein FE834_06005 [Gammaproteobacteria bacterium]|nr:hypothetical protein [Gammaproteobacteria bacterium]